MFIVCPKALPISCALSGVPGNVVIFCVRAVFVLLPIYVCQQNLQMSDSKAPGKLYYFSKTHLVVMLQTVFLS